MPTVWVIQEQPKHNVAPAMEFGEIVTVLPPGDNNFSVQDTLARLRGKLDRFQEHEDWLLLTGDPIAIGLATMVVGEFSRELRFLKWDRQERKYLPIVCDIMDRRVIES